MKRYRNATQWGVYNIDVEEGRIVDVRGVEEDPEPSDIGNVLLDGIQRFGESLSHFSLTAVSLCILS